VKTKTSSPTDPMNRSPLRLAFLLIPLAFASVLSPQVRAVCRQGCNLSNGNTFLGEDALINDSGVDNTAVGLDALFSNAGGSYNTATGFQALLSNTTGSFNTASGRDALNSNTTGSFNTANGVAALFSNTTGNSNTAAGIDALLNNATGSSNIALGNNAGSNLTTGDNNIDIGNTGVVGDSSRIRIGTRGTHTATFIAGISGAAVTGSQVIVNSNGKLGVTASSKRFKDEIKPMDKVSEVILSLEPVTFRYKQELDLGTIPQFGLVAEQVEKVNPDLVARDDDGKPYTVRYEAVNAMLLNEFLKEHRKVEKLNEMVAQHQQQIRALSASLKEQAAAIQKISGESKTREGTLQVALTNP